MSRLKFPAFTLLMVGLLLFTNEVVLEGLGLIEPPFQPITEQEKEEINRSLAADESPVPSLISVRFRENVGAGPINDQILVFTFDRGLTEFERSGLEIRETFFNRWHYSCHFQDPDIKRDPLNTRRVHSANSETDVIKVEVYEDVFYSSWNASPTINGRVSNNFQPGKLKSFSFRLYRWGGFGVNAGKRYDGLELIREWRSEDLTETSPGEWQVPADINNKPSEQAIEYFTHMNIPTPP